MSANEIRLFAKCRNESARLGAFFDHYRGLGVDRFFIVDNDSTDGSLDTSRASPTCVYFATPVPCVPLTPEWIG